MEIMEHRKHTNRRAQTSPAVAIPFRQCHTLAGNCVGQHVCSAFC